MTRTQVFGPRSRVIVDINETQAQRVFIRFADKDAKKRAKKVLAAAIEEAPVSKRGLHSAPRTGPHLYQQIKLSQSRDTRGRWETGYDVTSNAPYSLYVIKGTGPHPITGNPLLGFFWPKAGSFVVFRSVNHPGTRANNFLSRALRRAR